MIRYNLYLTNNQYRFLKSLSKSNSSVSEYIRIAVNEFIDKIKREELNVSASLSKGGDKDARRTDKSGNTETGK